ncbi:MAG: M23 family metallopeptidase [Lentimicrobiaceae bacterium]|nr:M23 family metallopeptidase [Lentimicrobiaceae bacterium]
MRCKILILLLFTYSFLFSQNEKFPQYPNPVKIPISLSATFAELRSNAFHAGVDIRTQGVEGKEVFAVADGYVSRIGVSPYGYGKVLYITHNDGFTSVYAHMSKFNKMITDFVKDKQYKDESFDQNIMLKENEFPIKRGDFLGFTGNSGSSGGPHLHYEIRYTKTQEPVNPLCFGLKIKDTKKPVIKGLAIYPLENSIVNNNDTTIYLNVNYNEGVYSLDNSIFTVSGDIAFGINVYDQADGANNKNGPYSIELFADNELIFNIISDKYSYNETRYINSLIDYSRYVKNKERFVRTEIDKYNNLGLYETRKGVVPVNQGDTIDMKYVVKDYNGNKSVLNFTLIGVKLHVDEIDDLVYDTESYYEVIDGNPLNITLKDFEMDIPKMAFYRDVVIETTLSDTMSNIYSDYVYHIGNEEIPVHKKATLRIKPKTDYIGDTLLYVALLNTNNEFVFLGNKTVDDYIEAKTNVLGSYLIARDTIAPSIIPVNFKTNSSISENWSLRVEIEDKETGIKDYAMFVNGRWVLADYDAKNKLLMYQIDNHIKEGDNILKVVVTDMVGNKNIYSTTLTR